MDGYIRTSGFVRKHDSYAQIPDTSGPPSHTCHYTSRWFKVMDEGVLCPSDVNEDNSHLLRLVVSVQRFVSWLPANDHPAMYFGCILRENYRIMHSSIQIVISQMILAGVLGHGGVSIYIIINGNLHIKDTYLSNYPPNCGKQCWKLREINNTTNNTHIC